MDGAAFLDTGLYILYKLGGNGHFHIQDCLDICVVQPIESLIGEGRHGNGADQAHFLALLA